MRDPLVHQEVSTTKAYHGLKTIHEREKSNHTHHLCSVLCRYLTKSSVASRISGSQTKAGSSLPSRVQRAIKSSWHAFTELARRKGELSEPT